MAFRGESSHNPAEYSSQLTGRHSVSGSDPRVALQNLSAVQTRMDSLQRFLSESVNFNAPFNKDQMDMVSSEISSAIQQIIVSGTALIACSRTPDDPPDREPVAPDVMREEEQQEDAGEIVELDAVEILAERIHCCEICGKGFNRDANLRMHMRAHGNQFKTPEFLAKPPAPEKAKTLEPSVTRRFSCPYVGCNRNKSHKKFRPLKSVICVKNHFKRSHCPKMYSCNRCNKKSFSVLADLKSHLKRCGEIKWRCTCGTSFSRKDKLFGHMALFEGHMPAVIDDDDQDEKGKSRNAMEEDDQDEDRSLVINGGDFSTNLEEDEFLDGLLSGFDSAEGFDLQDALWSP
ncbi:hypothetical protein FNV43_RR17607 [Rhamnella rubrinervis]|uniref:C2H2-type domain-containing protein n=1 Tax=Rhamnella rubrinervis TaxID=2594499 RepID=A0A8K0GXW9_9ROSA|nr:hypothetical protein FNV43_RR17607 [Rhamnella rubrinervis]